VTSESQLDQVRGVLTKAFPDDRCEKVVLAKDGWDNLVAIADERRVYRIPRNSDYPRFQERWALEKLRDRVTLAVPRIDRWSDDPPCMGYPLLPGISALPEWLAEPAPAWIDDLARSLAEFLFQCHQTISLNQAKTAGLREFRLSPFSFQELMDRAVDMNPADKHYAETLFRKAEEKGASEPQSFLYGDLHLGNLLFDPGSRRVTAVLDFGNVCWDDLSMELYDLAGYWPKLCDAIVHEYERLSGIRINRAQARRHAAIFCLSVFAEEKLSFMRPSAIKRIRKLMESE
jgi:aminoglycoside phosphotransferase (APT) family kinase protein